MKSADGTDTDNRSRIDEGPYGELKKWQMNPVVLFALIMFSIFSAEVLVMIVLGLFPGISRYALPLLDAFLLSALVFPMLYLLFFRPMTTCCKGVQAIEEREKSGSGRKA
jgi:hypothetical protein